MNLRKFYIVTKFPPFSIRVDTWTDRLFPHAFQPFHFFHNSEIDYYIPQPGEKGERPTKETYTDYIDTLPISNTPEVFGLHLNAEIGYYTQQAKDVWTQLIEMQPQTGIFTSFVDHLRANVKWQDTISYLQG